MNRTTFWINLRSQSVFVVFCPDLYRLKYWDEESFTEGDSPEISCNWRSLIIPRRSIVSRSQDFPWLPNCHKGIVAESDSIEISCNWRSRIIPRGPIVSWSYNFPFFTDCHKGIVAVGYSIEIGCNWRSCIIPRCSIVSRSQNFPWLTYCCEDIVPEDDNI